MLLFSIFSREYIEEYHRLVGFPEKWAAEKRSGSKDYAAPESRFDRRT